MSQAKTPENDLPVEDSEAESPEILTDAEPTPEEEAAKWKDTAYRATAELDNYRKRMARERLDLIQNANSGLLEDLLPVVDNFRMGIEMARQENDKSMIFIGMDMVRKQLDEFLANCGVSEIPAQGQPFDPSLHDAVGQEKTADVPEGQVLRVTRAGYKLREKLLRPASVIVAAAPDSDPA